jgi:hypothetical protein
MATQGNPLVDAAKAQLAGAEKKFPGSMAAAAGVKPAKERTAAPTAKKESLPAAAAPKENLSAELKAKTDNVKQYENAPKYHKGGKFKKDGVQVVNAEKGETILPNKGKKKVMELAMKHLDGMKEGMEHKAKKSEKHEEKPEHKKSAHKKHGKVKKMHIAVNDDDTFSMTHEHHPMEDGSPVADTTHSAPDMDGLMDHMQEHMGEPNPGEAEAEAGPAAPAAGAPAPAAA